MMKINTADKFLKTPLVAWNSLNTSAGASSRTDRILRTSRTEQGRLNLTNLPSVVHKKDIQDRIQKIKSFYNTEHTSLASMEKNLERLRSYKKRPVCSKDYVITKDLRWITPETTGTLPVWEKNLSMVPMKDKIILLRGEHPSSIFVLNPLTYHWRKVLTKNPPKAFSGHSAVPFDGKIVVFAGSSNGAMSNKVFSLNAETFKWQLETCYGAFPCKRMNHKAGVIGRHMVVYGGIDQDQRVLNDTYLLDLAKNRWISKQTLIQPTKRIMTNTLVLEDKLYLVGGRGLMGEILNDVWTFNTENYQWTSVYNDGIARDLRNHVNLNGMILGFEGRDYSKICAFNLVKNRWKQLNPRTEVPTIYSHCATVFGDKLFIVTHQHRNTNTQIHILSITSKI